MTGGRALAAATAPLAALAVLAGGCMSAEPAADPPEPDVAASGADCRRPYAPSSPWNTPIADDPPLDPRSADYVATLGDELTSDPTQYTYPVYATAPSGRRTSVSVEGWFSDVTNRGRTLVNREDAVVELAVPDEADAAAGSDAQLVVLDEATGEEWGFWQLRRNGNGWSATNGYHYNVRWSGVPPLSEGGSPFASRGAGIPYLAGLVRPCEIARGRIDHALAFAYDSPAPTHVYPATKSDGNGDTGDLPEGARLQLDPALGADELDALGCRDACLTIARALQRYGMYVVDNSGRAKVMLEYEGTARWNGLVDEHTVRPIPLPAFRVLQAAGAPEAGP